MIKNLWNIGIKVADLDRELVYLREVGASPVLREDRPGEELAIVRLGGVRLSLFPRVLFEDRAQSRVPPGLTHLVFEVDDLDKEYARIRTLGGEVLVEPMVTRGGFGTRRLVFFRSPGGLNFEVMQIIEDKLH